MLGVTVGGALKLSEASLNYLVFCVYLSIEGLSDEGMLDLTRAYPPYSRQIHPKNLFTLSPRFSLNSIRGVNG